MECWEPSQHSLLDTGKPRKTSAEVAGRRTFRILTSSQHPATKVIYTPSKTKVAGSRSEMDEDSIFLRPDAVWIGTYAPEVWCLCTELYGLVSKKPGCELYSGNGNVGR